MGHRLEEMPLLPLNAVLFPGAQLQVHIAEPNDVELITYCAAHDEPFGVLLIRAQESPSEPVEPFMVGTAVRVVSVHTFDDGKMDVRVQGQRRIRVRKFDLERSYMVGHVEQVFEFEIENGDEVEQLALLAREYIQAYIANYFAKFRVQIKLPPDPTDLSFAVANFLQIENRDKQKLLELTDTGERLKEMIAILEQHIVEAKHSEPHKMTRQHMEEWINPN